MTFLFLIAFIGGAFAATPCATSLTAPELCPPSYERLTDGLDSVSLKSEQPKERPRWMSAYRISQLAVLGGMAADISSSWGCMEANPLLRSADGRFYMKGTLIKVGITGGGLALAHLVKRRFPKMEKPLAFMLGGTSAMLYTTAFRNHSMPCY